MTKMLRLSFLLSFLLFTACVTPRSFEPYLGEEGHYRLRSLGTTGYPTTVEAALRDENGKIIHDEAKAKAVHARFDSMGEQNENIAGTSCIAEKLYDAQKAQYDGLALLHEKKYDEALEKLNQARNACPNIYRISLQSYLEAMAADGKGDKAQARSKLEEFLQYSSSVEPSVFHESERKDESFNAQRSRVAQDLKAYQKLASDYLSGTSSSLTLLPRDQTGKVLKMYPNGIFRPGGNREPGFAILPAFGYSTVSGSVFGVHLYKSWGEYALSPSFIVSSETGNLYGLKLRKSLFESPSRDVDVDLSASALTYKVYRVSSSLFGYSSEKVLVAEGINYETTLGATKRFRYPSLGVSVAMTGVQDNYDKRFEASGTLYGFYDLTQGIDVFAGLIQDNATAGVSFQFLQFGYSFRDQSIVLFINGFSF